MQSILDILKSRYFLIGVGFVLLIALTFFLGGWLEWSLVTQLLIVIGLLVVGIGLMIMEFVRASRSAAMIEKSIKMQAEQQRMSTRPDKQADIQELQDQLEKAIGQLKQSKLGRGRRGSNALHALPWYMFIGPPGAGKTTAIQNSGLNFPIGADRVRGVGGTRNCDWFFSDSAILLDTAGRYMTEHEDEEEWHAFLDMLKEHRTRRPINGIIIGISIADLLDAAPDEIEWHANRIRRRVSELVERLGVRFPVYLVFTKCDLVQGFVNFFGDLSLREREQIWGCTLTGEQREEGDPRSMFEHEFDRLYDALINARTERLRRSMKREERRKVYVFPLEFASAKENLALFVDHLFQPNPYQESPAFRGFYFTSGTQEGAPIDRVIQSISEQFDFAVGSNGGAEEPEMETKSYFIKDLFTDVIVPDQYMVEQTSKSARRGRFMRFGVGAAAAALLVLFVLLAGQAVVRSQMDISRVQEAAQAAALVQWDGQSGTDDLERIDRLRQEITQLERYENDPPFLRWGLYRGGTVLDPARTLFLQKLRPLVRAQFQQLEQQLASPSDAAGALDQQEKLRLREQLRAYLLLTEEVRRLRDEGERTFLRGHLTDQMLQPASPVLTAAMRERGGQVEQQIAAFVDGLGRQAVQPFDARSSLVERVRRLIYQQPTIENIYAQIKQQGENSLPPVRLSDMLRQSGGSALFANQPQVSGFFTKQGWETFVQERIAQQSKAPGEGDWVLGQSQDELSDELQDTEQVAQQLHDRYLREYATAWRQFLGRIEYASFGSLRATADALTTLGSPYESPLLYILAQATDQTRFQGSALDEAAGSFQNEVQRRAEGTARRQLGTREDLPSGSSEGPSIHPVNQRLAWLHRLKADEAVSGGAPPDLTQALEAIRNAGNALDGLIGDRARATEFAAAVLSANGGDLGQQLRGIGNALSQFDPRARRNLFEAPIVAGWRAVLGTAQQHLNDQWRERVHRPFQADLAGLYPFTPGGQQDAPLNTVDRFFHPQTGAMATFYEDYLRNFLRADRRRSQTWEGYGITFSSAAAAALNDADQIADAMFSGGALQLTFEVRAELPDSEGEAPPAGQIVIRVHGDEDTYSMGSQSWADFSWPGDPEAALTIQTREGSKTKRFEGAWAWFRLLEDAQVEPRTSNTYRVRWRFEQPGRYAITARYDLQTSAPGTLFTNPSEFFRFSVPETLN